MKPDALTWTPPPDARAASGRPPGEVRRILRLFHPYRGRLAVVGLLVGASSLVSVASPFLLREILDTAIPQGRTGLLTLLALGMILTAVMNSVFGVLQTLCGTCAVAVCSPLTALCNHHVRRRRSATNPHTITRSSEHPIPCSCVLVVRYGVRVAGADAAAGLPARGSGPG
ncbi:hypothetical protein SCYAM73S_03794 [Streptomyces cyaneofuscatus]